MINRLGYCCQNITLSDGKPAERVSTSRTYRMASHSLEKASDISYANCRDLIRILKWNEKNGIKYFRISSDMFPFMDHPDKKYDLDDLKNSKWIRKTLREAGEYARQHGHRLSMHPGQYTCIASPNDFTVDKSLLSLEMHNLIGDLLGMGNDFNINIHVGGTYGSKADTADRFCKSFDRLSDGCKARLTVENDDKESQWHIEELHELIHEKIGIPLCFDIHHWDCAKGEFTTVADAYELAEKTWGDIIPEVHYSEPKDPNGTGQKYRSHSDWIENDIPVLSNNPYDLMLEVKMKEKALLKCRGQVYSNELEQLNNEFELVTGNRMF